MLCLLWSNEGLT